MSGKPPRGASSPLSAASPPPDTEAARRTEQSAAGDEAPAPARRNFYGRIHGKTLRPSQKRYLAEVLPGYRLSGVSVEENSARTPLDPAILQGARTGRAPIWLEVGFGGGEHLVHMALRHPEARLIGCEPFVNGVAMALGRLRQTPAPNVMIHPGDARDLLEVLPEGCLQKVFLLYPDPWPKARHHRRRFVTPEHLEPLARACAPGAAFRIATDIPDYVRQALEEVPRAGFGLISQSHAPWDDWTRTRYEAKALREGRRPHYLTFQRAG